MKKYNKPQLAIRNVMVEKIIASSNLSITIANPNSGAHAVSGSAVDAKSRNVGIDTNIDF